MSYNLAVRQELIDAKVGDIGVLGTPSFAAEAKREWHAFQNQQISANELKERLAAAVADEVPQSMRGGNDTYADFYGNTFDRVIEYYPERLGTVVRGADVDRLP